MSEEKKESQGLWPSGLWTGFWTEPYRSWEPFRNPMDLELRFVDGRINGSGSDRVGGFVISGSYNNDDMKCSFAKEYASHQINYDGCRDGKGIYGQWWFTLPFLHCTGGFHIWPAGLEEKVEAEAEEEQELEKVPHYTRLVLDLRKS